MLKIITPERLGEKFTQHVLSLKYTPRKISIHPESSNLIINELEANCLTTEEREKVRKEIFKVSRDRKYGGLDERKIGYYGAKPNNFSSCLRIISPHDLKTHFFMEFQHDEVLFTQYITETLGKPGETYLILGTAMNPTLKPRSC